MQTYWIKTQLFAILACYAQGLDCTRERLVDMGQHEGRNSVTGAVVEGMSKRCGVVAPAALGRGRTGTDSEHFREAVNLGSTILSCPATIAQRDSRLLPVTTAGRRLNGRS